MPVDVLLLNTPVMDIRSADFTFTQNLVEPGGVTKCDPAQMPQFSQEQIRQWIKQYPSSAGGPGNSAPLIANAGLSAAVGGNLGSGPYGGLDAAGRAFYDILDTQGVDQSAMYFHPDLPTALTFLYDAPGERGGIVYFANANEDFDFARFRPHVERMRPTVLYYMYSGLSTRADANGGQDLSDFMKWCRRQGCITIADSHTLAANPAELIHSGASVDAYHLLEPLLPELDLFFTSSDEAKMIINTLDKPRDWSTVDELEGMCDFLRCITGCFGNRTRTQVFGVTYSRGACVTMLLPDGTAQTPRTIESRYILGDAVDLTGAGDSFRAGLISYVARHASAFQDGSINMEEAVQMGNLMACLYVSAPMENRYINLRPYASLMRAVLDPRQYTSFKDLADVLDG